MKIVDRLGAAARDAGLALGIAVAAGSLLMAGPAAAADYAGADDSWWGNRGVSWPVNIATCLPELQAQYDGQIFLVTIDGTTYSTAFSNYGQAFSPPYGAIRFGGVPLSGTLEKVTIGGADHLTCGSDRLLLPGYPPPPAPIPTLSEWAMILLGVLLAGGAALTIQRRRTA